MSDRIYTPVNPNSQECVKNVLKYLSDISFDKVITGQAYPDNGYGGISSYQKNNRS